MAKFCRYCGKPVSENAKFCRACGKQLTSTAVPAQQPQQSSPRQVYDGRAQQQPAAQQSLNYRQPAVQQGSYQQPVVQQQPQYQQPAERQKAEGQARLKAAAKREARKAKAAAQPVQAAVQQAAASAPQLREIAAMAGAGEMDCGDMIPSAVNGVMDQVSGVLSPIKGIFSSIGSYLGGIIGIFKDPKSLIGTVLIAVLWFILGGLRDSDSGIVKILSWLTFSEGGFDREALGMVGGVLGKGTVAAALLSLLRGGIPKAVKGIGALFKGHGEKRGIVGIIIGSVLGAVIYIFFVGPGNMSPQTTMAGIAGALLSLEALGGGKGKIYSLVQSLTSKVTGGIRTAMRGKCDSVLTGLTLGFALVSAVSALM